MQTLIAFGGIGGLALAFASQQVVANFFGGTDGLSHSPIYNR